MRMRILATMAVLAAGVLLFLGYRHMLPIHRAEYHSKLIMLGDFEEDRNWDKEDLALMRQLCANPFARPAREGFLADLNGDGRLDAEDFEIMERLCASGDPYLAEAQAKELDRPFPKPRELFRYVSSRDYLNRPLFALPYPEAVHSPLACLAGPRPLADTPYARQLQEEIRDEAIRFDLAYRARLPKLTPIERDYAKKKIESCNRLFAQKRDYDLLLELMGLVEDAETLTTVGQDPFVAKLLFFRDHLRELLASPEYQAFQAGRLPVQTVLGKIELALKNDLGIEVVLERLPPPRGLTHLQNYLDRAEWQYYKTRVKPEDFEKLLTFAQHDRRYLRAVARTTRKNDDLGVQNHNLPMVLLFREALRLSGQDRKAAIGLLDETIRIPFGWVRAIPPADLPKSLAMENFLLPGNKEDGADKSRHWNVFGGICIYKSPRESLDLALRRKMQDVRRENYAEEEVTDFIRDTISSLNGMYYVMSVKPSLLGAGRD